MSGCKRFLLATQQLRLGVTAHKSVTQMSMVSRVLFSNSKYRIATLNVSRPVCASSPEEARELCLLDHSAASVADSAFWGLALDAMAAPCDELPLHGEALFWEEPAALFCASGLLRKCTISSNLASRIITSSRLAYLDRA